MRTEIKWCINVKELQENQLLRNDALLYNQHNIYSKIEVPERLLPIYEKTCYNFKITNVIEPTVDKDIIVNMHLKGEIRLDYNQLLESKLELIFNGE